MVTSGTPCAVKVVRLSLPTAAVVKGLKALLHEAEVLGRVRHPNVVRCLGGSLQVDNMFIVEVGQHLEGRGARRVAGGRGGERREGGRYFV